MGGGVFPSLRDQGKRFCIYFLTQEEEITPFESIFSYLVK